MHHHCQEYKFFLVDRDRVVSRRDLVGALWRLGNQFLPLLDSRLYHFESVLVVEIFHPIHHSEGCVAKRSVHSSLHTTSTLFE